MATAAGVDDNADAEISGQQQQWTAKISSLPPTLTLRSKRMVLKTPTAEDDAVMCEIFSDPLDVEYLPHFHRAGGWTLEEMAELREKQRADQGENKGLTLYLHVFGNKTNRCKDDSRTGPDEVDEDLILVGTTGFTSINLESGESEVGIILHHPYWKKGLATEALYMCLRYAFETLGLQRVDWFTSVANKYMRGWCEDFMQMKPFDAMIDILGPSVGYSLSLSEWQSHASHFLEQKVSSRKS